MKNPSPQIRILIFISYEKLKGKEILIKSEKLRNVRVRGQKVAPEKKIINGKWCFFSAILNELNNDAFLRHFDSKVASEFYELTYLFKNIS